MGRFGFFLLGVQKLEHSVPIFISFFEFARIRLDWSLEHLGKVVVDFASVSDEKNYYLIFLRVYLVDYSIVAYSGAPEI